MKRYIPLGVAAVLVLSGFLGGWFLLIPAALGVAFWGTVWWTA